MHIRPVYLYGMMSAIMHASFTHRFSWRSWKPFIACVLLTLIAIGTLSPIAAPYANAQPVDPPAGTETESPSAIDPATAPEPPALSGADQTLCSPEFVGSPIASARCVFFNIIAEVMLLIASLLGRILVFMVDILIAFASYNDFGNTVVVARGWVIVRDICNMFFIVVLLVSAFSTIIGYYDDFHYKRVLPKLLLMAVLINFSRTLILLLVDFSQVMMLTFVNAFAQAGPGNLVAALKMEEVLKFAPINAESGSDTVGTAIANSGIPAGSVDPLNLILAIMLAIFMLSIALGVVIIMVGYLIFRIVGLWIALILSPIALFVTALPGKLQKGLDSFSGKYWARLSALLTGGPVMAFFLWLTFAITQNSAGEGGLAPALKFNVSNPTVTFLTTIGNSQDIASFIVGITLMLMGLDAAVTAAQQVNDTLGSFAKRTASASQALGKLAATSPFLAGYYGTRGAARYIDRRADITGKAATAAASVAQRIPILRTMTRKPLTDAMTKNKRLDDQEAKEFQAGLEKMSPEQRAIMSMGTPKMAGLATKGQRSAFAQQQLERAAPKNAQAMKDELVPGFRSRFMAEKQKELEAKGLSGAALQTELGKSARQIGTRAEQEADREVATRQSGFLKEAMDTARSMGDQDMIRSIEEQYKKNPHLSDDKAEMAKELLADKKALNGMSDQAKGDVSVLYSVMKEAGAMQTDNNGNVTGVDRAKMESFKDKISDKGLKENVEMVERYVNGQKDASGNQVSVSRAFFDGASIGKNEKGKTRMFQKGQLGPVSSMQEDQARAAYAANPTSVPAIESMISLGDAGAAFKDNASWGAYSAEASNDLSSLNAGVWDVDAKAGDPNHRAKADVEKALKKLETMASKLDDMESDRQSEYAGLMAKAGAVQAMIKAKKAGYSNQSRDANFKKYMEMLVKIETDVKKGGRGPTNYRTGEADALAALTELRGELQRQENKGVAGAYRRVVEPEELT